MLPVVLRAAAALLLLLGSAAGQRDAEEAAEADELATRAARLGVLRVRTTEQFRAGMEQGVPHLVIEEHLDLRSLATLPGNPPSLFEVNPALQSIQVRHAPLRLHARMVAAASKCHRPAAACHGALSRTAVRAQRLACCVSWRTRRAPASRRRRASLQSERCPAICTRADAPARVQGNCTAPPPLREFPLKGHRPPQCALYHAAFVFVVDDRASNLWLDRLFFRAARARLAEPEFFGGVLCGGDGARYRVTNTTFQGDGGLARGIGTETGCRSYAAGARARA